MIPHDFQDFARPWLKPLFIFLGIGAAGFAMTEIAPLIGWALDTLSPFIIALILAYIFNPIVNFVQQRLRLGRITGILFVAFAVALLAAGLLIWLLPLMYHQLLDALSDLRSGGTALFQRVTDRYVDPAARASMQARFNDLFNDLDATIKSLASGLNGALKPMAASSAAAVRSVAGGVMHTVSTVGGAVANFFFILVICFYFLAQMDRIPRVIQLLLPPASRERFWGVLLKINRAVGGFLRGQILDCIAVGALSSLLLFVIGLKQYAILIGFFAGMMNFIPYLGPIMGGAPAVLWVLCSSSLQTWDDRGVKMALVVAVFAVVQMVDGFVFQPFIVGRHASLHPLMVMLALAAGARFGIGGMIMAVPAACIARVLWLEFFWLRRVEGEAAPGAGPCPAPVADAPADDGQQDGAQNHD